MSLPFPHHPGMQPITLGPIVPVPVDISEEEADRRDYEAWKHERDAKRAALQAAATAQAREHETRARIIQMFGGPDDYERLEAHERAKLSLIPPSLKKDGMLIRELIKANKIYIMDKEYGCAVSASGIIGYNGKLLLFIER